MPYASIYHHIPHFSSKPGKAQMQKDKDYANAILNDYTSSILAHIASLLGAMA